MSETADRVSRLERAHEAKEENRTPRRRGRWELPGDQWQLGAVSFSHEDALAELDAEKGGSSA